MLADNPKALTAIALSLTVLLGLDSLSWLFDRFARKRAEAMSLEQLFAASGVDLTPIDYSMPAAPAVEISPAEPDTEFASRLATAVAEATALGEQYRSRVLASFLSQTGTPSGSPPQGCPAALHS